MKKALLLWVCCLGIVVGRAQHFSNLYYDNHPYATFNSIEEYNGSIYTSGMTAQIDTPQYYKGLFAKIGNDGNLNYLKNVADTLPNNCYLYWNNLKKTADGNFLAVAKSGIRCIKSF